MKNLTFKIVLIFAIMAMAGSAYAQNRQVTGTVKDTTGAPVIGASIAVEGTSLGTTSNIDGSFAINVPQGDATLVVSFLGYRTQRISTGGVEPFSTSYWKRIRPISTRSSSSDTAFRRRAS